MSRHGNVTEFRGLDGGNGGSGHDKHQIKQEPMTPRAQSPPHYVHDFEFNRIFSTLKLEPLSPKMQPLSRPSLSLGDLTALRADMKLDLGERSNVDRRDDVMRRYNRKLANSPTLSRTKFVSMAEAIYHFQRDTPGRFHTTDCRTEFQPQPGSLASRTARTMPQSPALRCATRARPLRLLTQEQREMLELEEIRKHKIKANPVPRAVTQGGYLPDVVRRERTVPEPFNLTEVPRRAPPQPDPKYVFKAHPVPRRILEKPHVPPKPATTVTQPVTPNFVKIRAHSHEHIRRALTPPLPVRRAATKFHHRAAEFTAAEVPHHGVGQLAARTALGPLRPIPFSFEKRDEYTRKKKEEKIKQIMEEEKSLASQFKANPVPKMVRKKTRETSKRSETSSASSENKENYKFEARPPLVLAQKPFKPVLVHTQVTELKPFALTTVRRASERELFERQLREKEEEAQQQAERRERERQQAEERERAILRTQMVHRAQPVPDLVPFVPEKSHAPLTEPQTPMFVRRMKKAH